MQLRRRERLEAIQIEDLYDAAFWPMLRRIVRFIPNGDTVPVRMRMRRRDPYTIAVTPFTSTHSHWYTLADAIAAKILGGTVPSIDRAYEFYPREQNEDLCSIDFLGAQLDPTDQIFRKVIEDRQLAKEAKRSGSDSDLARRDLALKTLANSGAYGIYAEVNVSPDPKTPKNASHASQERVWYADVGPNKGKAHDERPGAFFNPIIASLDTGGARLMLAILEAEVTLAGGTFAFCDTDSLAIVAGDGAPEGIPCLSEQTVAGIIHGFNRLNPYNPELVPRLLKREYPEIHDLRCYAISAKRYALYRLRSKQRIHIIKASESGIGAAIGRTGGETVRKLARRIWTAIVVRNLGIKYRGLRKRRLSIICDFNAPFRRRFPIAQPRIWKSKGFDEYNAAKNYDFQIKPFNFLQTITPAVELGDSVLPIAPFERDLAKSSRLPWTDFRTGDPVRLDWDGSGASGTVPVMRLDEFVSRYANHPESKAAGPDGKPATEDTRGLLGRLHLQNGEPSRIGKEIDRLDEDDGSALEWDESIVYDDVLEATLEAAISVLRERPRRDVSRDLMISERRLQDIVHGRARPRSGLRAAIIDLAKSISSQEMTI